MAGPGAMDEIRCISPVDGSLYASRPVEPIERVRARLGPAREAQLPSLLLDEAHRLELGAGVQPEAKPVEERGIRERQHSAQALDDLRRHLAGVERQRRVNSRAHRQPPRGSG